jgi:hypothetical protein
MRRTLNETNIPQSPPAPTFVRAGGPFAIRRVRAAGSGVRPRAANAHATTMQARRIAATLRSCRRCCIYERLELPFRLTAPPLPQPGGRDMRRPTPFLRVIPRGKGWSAAFRVKRDYKRVAAE